MVAEYFTNILTLAGSIAGIGIVGLAIASFFSPGAAALLQTILKGFVDFLQRTVFFVLNHMPKGMRVLVVLLLLGSIGGAIYAYTLGATKMCYKGDVYDVDMATAISFKALKEGDKIDASPYAPETNTSLNSPEKVRELLVTNGCIYCNSSQINMKGSLLATDGAQIIMAQAPNGERYSILQLIAPTNDLVSDNKVDTAIQLWKEDGGRDFFERWIGPDWFSGEWKVYDICYSPKYKTCAMDVRPGGLGGDQYCGSLNGGSSQSDWNVPIFKFMYILTPSDTGVEPTVSGDYAFNVWRKLALDIGIVSGVSSAAESLDRCSSPDGDSVEGTGFAEGATAPIKVRVKIKTGIFGTNIEEHDLWVHNAKVGNLVLFQLENETGGTAHAIDVYQAERNNYQVSMDAAVKDWTAAGAKNPTALGGLVTFSCTADKTSYETELRVGGINPFSMTFLMFMALFAFIIYIQGILNR